MATSLAAPGRHAHGAALNALAKDVVVRLDFALLALVIFAASGAIYRYGAVNTYLWYIVYAWTAARLALAARAFSRTCLANWPIFIWPALAIASVAWSLAPASSLRGGLQLLMTTVIAIFIGMRFSMRQILWAVTFVLAGAGIVSIFLLLAGAANLFAEAGGFQGIFAHKNTMGVRMNILIAAALLLFIGARRWAPALLVILIVAVYILVLSKSATSQILGIATPGLLIGMALVKRDARALALGGAACTSAAALLAAALFSANGDPVSFVLDSFGKDTTLTGRTWLWAEGFDQIRKHPVIGGGYQAFWVFERSSDVVWIRYNTLETVKGFHNVGVEVWNDLGLPGLAALVGVIAAYVARTFRFYWRASSFESIYPLFFTAIVIISASMNNSFFRQHELVHILIGAFYAGSAMTLRSPIIRGATAHD